MKKLTLCLVLMLVFSFSVLADRNTATVQTYNSSQLIKRGDGIVYSVTFVASANGGDFILYDNTIQTLGATEGLDDIKAEGSEVTSLGSQFQDFSDKPLEFGTGIYLVVNDGYVTLAWE